MDESAQVATVGNPLQNAIWEEFGTGEYALEGDGRKTPWRYKDEKDIGIIQEVSIHAECYTKRSQRLRNRYKKALEDKLKEGMK